MSSFIRTFCNQAKQAYNATLPKINTIFTKPRDLPNITNIAFRTGRLPVIYVAEEVKDGAQSSIKILRRVIKVVPLIFFLGGVIGYQDYVRNYSKENKKEPEYETILHRLQEYVERLKLAVKNSYATKLKEVEESEDLSCTVKNKMDRAPWVIIGSSIVSLFTGNPHYAAIGAAALDTLLTVVPHYLSIEIITLVFYAGYARAQKDLRSFQDRIESFRQEESDKIEALFNAENPFAPKDRVMPYMALFKAAQMQKRDYRVEGFDRNMVLWLKTLLVQYIEAT
jgi:hypothetical protein